MCVNTNVITTTVPLRINSYVNRFILKLNNKLTEFMTKLNHCVPGNINVVNINNNSNISVTKNELGSKISHIVKNSKCYQKNLVFVQINSSTLNNSAYVVNSSTAETVDLETTSSDIVNVDVPSVFRNFVCNEGSMLYSTLDETDNSVEMIMNAEPNVNCESNVKNVNSLNSKKILYKRLSQIYQKM